MSTRFSADAEAKCATGYGCRAEEVAARSHDGSVIGLNVNIMLRSEATKDLLFGSGRGTPEDGLAL
jgi:hypothetical protein